MWPVRWFVVFPGLGWSQSCLRGPCNCSWWLQHVASVSLCPLCPWLLWTKRGHTDTYPPPPPTVAGTLCPVRGLSFNSCLSLYRTVLSLRSAPYVRQGAFSEVGVFTLKQSRLAGTVPGVQGTTASTKHGIRLVPAQWRRIDKVGPDPGQMSGQGKKNRTQPKGTCPCLQCIRSRLYFCYLVNV